MRRYRSARTAHRADHAEAICDTSSFTISELSAIISAKSTSYIQRRPEIPSSTTDVRPTSNGTSCSWKATGGSGTTAAKGYYATAVGTTTESEYTTEAEGGYTCGCTTGGAESTFPGGPDSSTNGRHR